jgi:hypothetical protein
MFELGNCAQVAGLPVLLTTGIGPVPGGASRQVRSTALTTGAACVHAPLRALAPRGRERIDDRWRVAAPAFCACFSYTTPI